MHKDQAMGRIDTNISENSLDNNPMDPKKKNNFFFVLVILQYAGFFATAFVMFVEDIRLFTWSLSCFVF